MIPLAERVDYNGWMQRFVLLRHDCPPAFGKPSHWDLMLERDGALMTWNLPTLPEAWQAAAGNRSDVPIELTAERLADHRIAYLDYEGPVSGNRGRVARHDFGKYDVLEEHAERIRLRLSGQHFTAVVTLPNVPPTPAPA
jgi:hypothetical protein